MEVKVSLSCKELLHQSVTSASLSHCLESQEFLRSFLSSQRVGILAPQRRI